MKKINLLVLMLVIMLIPNVTKAEEDVKATLECPESVKVNEEISCKIILSSESKNESVVFKGFQTSVDGATVKSDKTEVLIENGTDLNKLSPAADKQMIIIGNFSIKGSELINKEIAKIYLEGISSPKTLNITLNNLTLSDGEKNYNATTNASSSINIVQGESNNVQTNNNKTNNPNTANNNIAYIGLGIVFLGVIGLIILNKKKLKI